MDFHPLTQPAETYSDALNATLLTYNGNENIMLNDMGNTMIQDTKTGNIMGLREGFVPVGLKEHGGVMYIASVNKDGKGEIGTIPSPVLRINNVKNFCTKSVVNFKDITNHLVAGNSAATPLINVTTIPLSAGNLFTVLLLIPDRHISVHCVNTEKISYPIFTKIKENKV